jgi:MerR family transcriptional regulator, thiopeptide resistance regulator
MVGAEPGVNQRFRQALEQEPALQVGRLMSDDVLEYLRNGLARA